LLHFSVDGEDDPFAHEVLDNIGRGGTRLPASSDDESDDVRLYHPHSFDPVCRFFCCHQDHASCFSRFKQGPIVTVRLGQEFELDAAMEVRSRLLGGHIVGWELGEDHRPFGFQIMVASFIQRDPPPDDEYEDDGGVKLVKKWRPEELREDIHTVRGVAAQWLKFSHGIDASSYFRIAGNSLLRGSAHRVAPQRRSIVRRRLDISAKNTTSQ